MTNPAEEDISGILTVEASDDMVTPFCSDASDTEGEFVNKHETLDKEPSKEALIVGKNGKDDTLDKDEKKETLKKEPGIKSQEEKGGVRPGVKKKGGNVLDKKDTLVTAPANKDKKDNPSKNSKSRGLLFLASGKDNAQQDEPDPVSILEKLEEQTGCSTRFLEAASDPNRLGDSYASVLSLPHENSSVETVEEKDDGTVTTVAGSVTKDATVARPRGGAVLRYIFTTRYQPDPSATTFLERLQEQTSGNVSVKVTVLSSVESRRFFGVPLANRGIQPVWIEVDNTEGKEALYLDRIKLDPNYYPPSEAAMVCHHSGLQRVAEYGFLSKALFVPLAILLPLKLVTAGPANRYMNRYFAEHSFPPGLMEAGKVTSGFFFSSLDVGTKLVNVDLLSPYGAKSMSFFIPIPGVAVDYLGKEPMLEKMPIVECTSEEDLKERLEREPRAVTNKRGNREGDPVNLVVVGSFTTLLTAFGSRWDETEVVNWHSCVKTAESFVLKSQYRFSPVSPLYLYGRSQDFALQRTRGSISERLHLRLWLTPMRFEGKPVWVGQVSRDIGVKLARTWNLTTHKIDPNVDEARDYVVDDLRQSGHLDRVGSVKGVGVSTEFEPRVNLTGDPYVTNGKRAVLILSPTKTLTPKILAW